MNDQIASLKFYLTIIANANEYSVADLAGHRADCEEFVEDALSDFTNRFLEKQITRLWTSAGAPLPLAMLDIPRYYDEAVRAMEPTTEGNGVPTSQDEHPRLTKYTNAVEKSKGREDAERMRDDVTAMWKRVEYVLQQPTSRNRAYGLAVGRVQSGKTQNYIGLILRAIDAGWNTIILLTSKNKMLARQTNDRIQKCFAEIGQTVNPLAIATDEGGIRWQVNQPWNSVNANFGIAIKDHSHIEWIRQWLTNQAGHRPEMKLLIVDDESDSATPDGQNVGGIVFRDDDEIRQVAAELRQYPTNDSPRAAEWVEHLIGEDSNLDASGQRTLADFATGTPARKLREAMIQNAEVLKILGFKDQQGAWVEIGASGRRLFEVVMGFFDRKKPRRGITLVYQKALLAILRYIADERPSHSVINAAMRVIAGRSQDVPGMPVNDVRPYEYGKMAYVAYTATPYANMLNEDTMHDPLAPDFIRSLSVSRKYIGFDRVFGQTGMDIKREISTDDDHDEGLILENIGDPRLVQDSPDDLIFSLADSQTGVAQTIEWSSLKKSIAWWVCSAAARRIARSGMPDGEKVKRDNRWTTMILNVSHETGNHDILRDLVTTYLNNRLCEANREGFVAECLGLWREERTRFTRQNFLDACSAEMPYPSEPADYPANETEVEEAIRWFVTHRTDCLRVAIINATDSGKDDSASYCDEMLMPDADVAWILCGGNVISRGLTLPGLTATYIDRIGTGTSVDTITQMGRWFGYREGYELLPRVWLTDDSLREMSSIGVIEKIMHEKLSALYDQYVPTYDSAGNEADERPLSPIFDKNRYSCIAFFGRQLSGRAKAMQPAALPGLSSIRDSLKDFKPEPEVQVEAFHIASDFIHRLNTDFAALRVDRAGDASFAEAFHAFPYWEGLSKNVVLGMLKAISPAYPETSPSSRNLGGLIHEIESSHANWDVVLGNANTEHVVNGLSDVFGIHGYMERPSQPDFGRMLSFNRNHTSATGYFANVRVEDINLGECDLVESCRDRGLIDDLVAVVTKDALDADLARVKGNPKLKLDAKIRNHPLFHFGKNRHVSDDYLESVFSRHLRHLGRNANPILLIDFIKPSGSDYANRGFYPVISYYWPGHPSTNYIFVTTSGESATPGALLTANAQVMVGLIRDLIESQMIISSYQLEEELRKHPNVFSEDDFRTALTRFYPINGGALDDLHILSREWDVYCGGATFDQLLDRRLALEPGDFVEELNELVIKFVVDQNALKDIRQATWIDFKRYIVTNFRKVFPDGVITNFLWPRFQELGGGAYEPVGIEDNWEHVVQHERDGGYGDGLYSDPERSRSVEEIRNSGGFDVATT